nr:unnamed protein product [Digitaria exilis]
MRAHRRTHQAAASALSPTISASTAVTCWCFPSSCLASLPSLPQQQAQMRELRTTVVHHKPSHRLWP